MLPSQYLQCLWRWVTGVKAEVLPNQKTSRTLASPPQCTVVTEEMGKAYRSSSARKSSIGWALCGAGTSTSCASWWIARNRCGSAASSKQNDQAAGCCLLRFNHRRLYKMGLRRLQKPKPSHTGQCEELKTPEVLKKIAENNLIRSAI